MENENDKKGIIARGIQSVMDQAYRHIATQQEVEELVEANHWDVDELIKWQSVKAGAAGFVTGVPGFAALPVTLPANLASSLYNQLRLIAGIAYIRGYDLKDEKVQTMAICCLLGNQVNKVLKDVAKKSLQAAVQQYIARYSAQKLAQEVAENLAAKIVAQNAGKLVPLVGGLVNLVFDSASTYAIGNAAKKMFAEQ